MIHKITDLKNDFAETEVIITSKNYLDYSLAINNIFHKYRPDEISDLLMNYLRVQNTRLLYVHFPWKAVFLWCYATTRVWKKPMVGRA